MRGCILRKVFLHAALLVLAILLRIPSSNAQTLYGSLTGNMTDSTGGIIPGVLVTATRLETNWRAEAVTNDSGVYLIRNLPAGRYELRVSLTGFKEHVSEGVVVSVGNITRQDVTLQVGDVSESVIVQGNSTGLQTDVTDVHAEFNSRQLTSLPLNQFRNYQSLFNLVPGVAPAELTNAIADTPERSLVSGANGTPGNTSGTRIDGAPSVNINLSHLTVYVPPAETIEVVHISTGSFSPDQGFAASSAINVITKSGTNEFHGSGFWFHENNALNARNFFNFLDTDGDGKANEPPGRRHIWGGTLGGPIIRDRLFFFAGFEALQQGLGGVSTSTVPTEDQRRGDFSVFLPVSAGGSCSGKNCTVIYDPSTGSPDGTGKSPFPNNIIPENRFSSPALKMQSLLPMPNLAGPIGNYEAAGQNVMNRYSTDLRTDWYRNARHRLWGKLSWMDATVIGQPRFGLGGGEAIGGGGAGEGRTDTRIYTFGHNWSLSPRFLTDGNLSITDRDQEVVGFDIGLGNFGADVLGIPGSNPTAEQEKACQVQGRSVCTGQPAFRVNGFDGFGATDLWMPLFRYQNSFSLSQNFSWTNGNHELRFGYDGLKLMHDGRQPFSTKGLFVFSFQTTSIPGANSTPQNAWASFLLGTPIRMQKGLQWELTTTREWQHAFYLGDRWQVTRKLTLTAGFRFEHFPFVKRDDRNVEWVDYGSTMPCGHFDPSPPCFAVVLDNDIGSQPRLAPRIGLAYRPSDKNVLRAGYGIANSPLPFGRTHGFGVYPMEIAADFESADPFVPQFRLEEGIPNFVGPDTSPGARIPLPSFVSFRGSAPAGTKRAYIQSWNLTLERKFPSDLVISLAYVGTQTTNRSVLRNRNWSKPGTGAKGLQLYPFNTAFQGVFDGAVSANYHSLQMAVNRQLDKGLSLRGAYTWAKGISGSWWEEDGFGRLAFHDPALWSRNRTVDSLTRPHNLQLATLYQLPFGSRSGVVNSIVRDWALNGIFSLHSNTPSTVVDNGSALRAVGNDQTADQVKPKIAKLGGIGPGNPYFDPQAFTPVSRVPGVDCADLDCYGNSGGKILRGPAWVNLSLSAFRRFAPAEEVAVELRVEALNFTNTPHFVLNPSLDVRNSDYMEIKSTSPNAPNRIIRLGVRLSF